MYCSKKTFYEKDKICFTRTFIKTKGIENEKNDAFIILILSLLNQSNFL